MTNEKQPLVAGEAPSDDGNWDGLASEEIPILPGPEAEPTAGSGTYKIAVAAAAEHALLVEQETARGRRRWEDRVERRSSGRVLVVGLLAVAAVLLMVIGRGDATDPAPTSTDIPAYELSFTAGASMHRAAKAPAANETVIVDPARGGTVSAVLRPSAEFTGDVAMRAFRLRGNVAQTWPLPVEKTDTGELRIQGPAQTLMAFEPGEWTLVFAVGPEPLLPESPSDAAAVVHGSAPANGWQLLTLQVRIAQNR